MNVNKIKKQPYPMTSKYGDRSGLFVTNLQTQKGAHAKPEHSKLLCELVTIGGFDTSLHFRSELLELFLQLNLILGLL